MKYQRLLSAGLAMLLVVTTAYAAFENGAAQRAFERYTAQVDRAEQEYASAMAKATSRYRDDLEKALHAARRSGSSTEVREIEDALSRIGDGEGRARQLSSLLPGTEWAWSRGPIRVRFGQDAFALSDWSEPGRWRAISEQSLVAESASGERWTITVDARGRHLLCITDSGEIRTATLIE